MNYKLLNEDDDKFHVEHPDGSSFMVAKQGLGKGLVDKIKAYGTKMADGGKAQPQDNMTALMDSLNAQPLVSEGNPVQEPLNPNSNQAIFQNNLGSLAARDVFGQEAMNAKLGNPDDIPIAPNPQLATQALADTAAQRNIMDTSKQQQDQQADQTAAAARSLGVNLPGAVPAPEITPPTQVNTENNINPGSITGLGGQPGMPTFGGALPKELQDINQSMMAQNTALAKSKAGELAQQAQAYQQYQTDLAAHQAKVTSSLQDLDNQNIALQKGITDGKIDPTRLWNNASTGNKVLASIALALGGGGAGLSHSTNLAAEMMQKAIDRDIDAQKIEIGKKENLLSYNLKKFGNITEASTATKLQLAASLQAQIASYAGRSGSQQALIAGQLANNQLKQTMFNQKIELYKIGMNNFALTHGVPEGQEPYALLSNPDYRKQRVPVNGIAYQATGTDKDASDMRMFEAKSDQVMQGVQRLNELGKDKSAFIKGTPANLEAEGIRAGLSTAIAGMKSMEIGGKSINIAEGEAALKQIQDPSKLAELLNGDVKNQAFFNDMLATREAMRHQQLLGYKGVESVKGRQPGFK